MENLEGKAEKKNNPLKRAWEAVTRFYSDIRVPKRIRKEGREAIEFYKNMEVPVYVQDLGKEGVKGYKEVRTILNTPKARRYMIDRMHERLYGKPFFIRLEVVNPPDTK